MTSEYGKRKTEREREKKMADRCWSCRERFGGLEHLQSVGNDLWLWQPLELIEASRALSADPNSAAMDEYVLETGQGTLKMCLRFLRVPTLPIVPAQSQADET